MQDTFDAGWEKDDFHWMKPNRNVRLEEADIKTVTVNWVVQPDRIDALAKRMEQHKQNKKESQNNV
jgi:hypothetical protein